MEESENGAAAVRKSCRKRGLTGKAAESLKQSSPEMSTNKNSVGFAVWTVQDLDRLLEMVKTEGFDGDYKAAQVHFPYLTEHSIRALINQLTRTRNDPNDDENDKSSGPKKSKKSEKQNQKETDHNVVSQAPIEEWMQLLTHHNETQRLGSNLSTMLGWIAEFEDHPDPAECGGVDYAEIYSYISTLMKGLIPKQLSQASAAKLLNMFRELTNIIRQSASISQQLLLQHVKQPLYNPKTIGQVKNTVLRERRRTVWSEAELKEAEDLKGTLPQVKHNVCHKPGLNPFSLPPTI